MDFSALNAAFAMKPQTKTIGEFELSFVPLTASQRIQLYKYASDNGQDITHIQALSICESCRELSVDNLDEVKAWEPEVLGELSDFVQKISGVDKDASEEAEKN